MCQQCRWINILKLLGMPKHGLGPGHDRRKEIQRRLKK